MPRTERTPEGLLVDFGEVEGTPFSLWLPNPTVFSFHHEDGRVWLFDVGKAQALAQAQLAARGHASSIVLRDLADGPEAWIAQHRDLSTERALALTPEQVMTPIIAVFIDEAHMLIDGHHRVLWGLIHQVQALFIEILADPEQVEGLVTRLEGEQARLVREAGI